jgi:hypothetical protein
LIISVPQGKVAGRFCLKNQLIRNRTTPPSPLPIKTQSIIAEFISGSAKE